MKFPLYLSTEGIQQDDRLSDAVMSTHCPVKSDTGGVEGKADKPSTHSLSPCEQTTCTAQTVEEFDSHSHLDM